MTCIVCNNTQSAKFASKHGFDIFRCPECGLLFVWPVPSGSNAIYSDDYFSGAHQGFGYADYDRDKSVMAGTFRKYLDLIGRYAPRKRRLLDVGAATGYFVGMAQADGWQASGVEISPWAAQTARCRNLDVATGTLKDAGLPDESFEAVTGLDVFEHLPDPKGDLEIMRRILKPGGILALNTPDAGSWYARLLGSRWHLLVPPEHLFYFNTSNIRTLLERHGFEVLKIAKPSKSFTLRYVFQTLSNSQAFFLWRWLATATAGTPLGSLSIPINFRDNFFVVARKI
jgi:spore maturation protein CgeB